MAEQAPCAEVDAVELERIAGRGWPGTEAGFVGEWWLRAGGGFTGRANSTLPLGDPGTELDGALARVVDWYAERDLVAALQVPLPQRADLAAALVRRGWVEGHGAAVMVAGVAAVLGRPGAAAHEVVATAEPDAAWRSLYHYRGAASLPPVALDVLRAGPPPAFSSLRLHEKVAAICRTVVADGWVGISAVEVAAAHRRRGLAVALMHAVLHRARDDGARCAYLQVEHGNAAAEALYAGLGFAVHHTYRYLRAPPRSSQP